MSLGMSGRYNELGLNVVKGICQHPEPSLLFVSPKISRLQIALYIVIADDL